jgi:hypothetical protein
METGVSVTHSCSNPSSLSGDALLNFLFHPSLRTDIIGALFTIPFAFRATKPVSVHAADMIDTVAGRQV